MEQLEELHNKLIEIISEVDKICRDNNLKYTLMGGSLIGAIRHNGFIPWDDDLDIGLKYNDYCTLIKIIVEMNHPWLEVDYHNSNDYEEQFAKIYDSRTTLKEAKSNRIKGVFIDVFPILPIANNMFIAKCRYYKDTILKMSRYNMTNDSKSSKIKMFIYKIVGMFYNPKSLTKKIQKNRYRLSKKKYKFSNDPDGSVCGIVPSTIFDNYIDHKFENLNLMIIKEYNQYLTLIFGDYMKLPPEDKRIPGHFEILDLHKSYKEWSD